MGTALFPELLGLALMGQSWQGLLISLIHALWLPFRVKAEATQMIEVFGEKDEEYASRLSPLNIIAGSKRRNR